MEDYVCIIKIVFDKCNVRYLNFNQDQDQDHIVDIVDTIRDANFISLINAEEFIKSIDQDDNQKVTIIKLHKNINVFIVFDNDIYIHFNPYLNEYIKMSGMKGAVGFSKVNALNFIKKFDHTDYRLEEIIFSKEVKREKVENTLENQKYAYDISH